MMNATLPDRDARVARIKSAVAEVRDAPNLSVRVWCEYGEEHFHPDTGEYWKPENVTVEGDMNDMATLRVLSAIMENHGLKVHSPHGVSMSGDDWARLVVDSGADA